MFAISVAVGALTVASGCSSSSSTDSTGGGGGGITAGNYIGEITIEGSKPFVAGTSKFTVDAAGNIKGTVTTTSKSDVPGDVGSLTGTTKAGATGLVELELAYDSAKLGRYTAKGSEAYTAAVKRVAFAPSARNASNVVVGRFFFLGEPE